MRAIGVVFACIALVSLAPLPAGATFHLMQIEQAIGGVDGHTEVQAVQLRMRFLGQSEMQFARLRAWDAAGANPVLLINFTTPVINDLAGDRVLIATSNLSAFTNPPLTPDYVFTNPIPASYLAAGSLTFEDDAGTILWRLSWGGAGYGGSNLGSVTNDADGNFGPPFPGALASSTKQAVRFKNAASAASTNNLNDYLLTAGAATLTNNARSSSAIVNTVGVGDPSEQIALRLGAPAPNPVRDAMTYSVALPRAAHVRVRLLDAAGRVVRTLADRPLPAGRHALTWRATGGGGAALPSGLYFLHLDTDGARRTQRVALIQ